MMRICHFGNMANNAYAVVNALRQRGEEADLWMYQPSHVTCMPQWENIYSTISGKLAYRGDLIFDEWKLPEWIKVIRWGNKLSNIGNYFKIIREMRKYDVVVAHTHFHRFCPFTFKDYIVFDAGAVRDLNSNIKGMKHVRRGYHYADVVMVTNPDTLKLFSKSELYSRSDYPDFLVNTPFLIDTRKYKVKSRVLIDEMCYTLNLHDDFIVFSPCRQNWELKGNHLLIHAFKKLLATNKKAQLVLTRWGKDVDKSDRLIRKLKMKFNVAWVGLMSKPRLILLYNVADVVADQFVLGSYGTATCEAMSCSKPVLVNLNLEYVKPFFNAYPPHLQAKTVDEIYYILVQLLDKKYRDKIGEKGRRWVLKHHSPKVVTDHHLKVYENLLEMRK